MFRAPLVMAGAFALTAVAAGVGAERMGPLIAVAVLGAFVALALGYAYVALVVWLRHLCAILTGR